MKQFYKRHNGQGYTDPRFKKPMGETLRELGLQEEDVTLGQHITIPTSNPPPSPTMPTQEDQAYPLTQYNEFDALYVLNSIAIPAGEEVWLWINKFESANRLPLHQLKNIQTHINKAWIWWSNAFTDDLSLILGGDLLVFALEERVTTDAAQEITLQQLLTRLNAYITDFGNRMDTVDENWEEGIYGLDGATPRRISVDDQGRLVIAPMPITIGQVEVLGKESTAYESLTVVDSATALTNTVYTADHRYAFISVEEAPIRIRLDGVDPTATEGILMSPGDTLTLDSHEDIETFRAIRTTSTSGIIRVSYSEVVS